MYAPDAALLRTGHSIVRPRPPWPVDTPLRFDRWQYHLQRYKLLPEFQDVLDGIRFGFSLNSSISITSTRIYRNHQSANDHPEVIEEAIKQELAANRYRGPFSQKELENLLGPFISHPLGVVPKSNGKWRLIEDLSWPRDGSFDSVNSLTDLSDVIPQWGGFAEAMEMIITAAPGSQGATLDWKDAFRNIPVHPKDFWTSVLAWPSDGSKSRLYVDLAHKFGHSRSPGNFDRPNQGFMAICRRMNLGDLIAWVDDLLSRRQPLNQKPPWIYSFDIIDIRSVAFDLGISLPLSKVQPFSFSVVYLGFLWHFDSKSVEIPPEKKQKGITKITTALTEVNISIDSLRSLAGFLAYLAMAILPGRAHLRSLYAMTSRMESTDTGEFKKWSLFPNVVADLEWWRDELSRDYVGMSLCTERFPDDSLHVYVDASTNWGIGVVISGSFDRFRLQDGWKKGELGVRDIGWAEFVAVELAVFFLISSFKIHDRHLLIHSDNMGVVEGWKNRSSRNAEQNAILLRIMHMLNSCRSFVTLDYVPSAQNPADPPSRGLDPPSLTRAYFKGFPTDLRYLLQRN